MTTDVRFSHFTFRTSTKEHTACYGYRSRGQGRRIGRRGGPRFIRYERAAIVFSKVVGFRARRQLIVTNYEPLLPREARGVPSEKPRSTNYPALKGKGSGRGSLRPKAP
jgi:hypothetical protein